MDLVRRLGGRISTASSVRLCLIYCSLEHLTSLETPNAHPAAHPTAPPTAHPTAPPTAAPTAPPTATPTAPPTAPTAAAPLVAAGTTLSGGANMDGGGGANMDGGGLNEESPRALSTSTAGGTTDSGGVPPAVPSALAACETAGLSHAASSFFPPPAAAPARRWPKLTGEGWRTKKPSADFDAVERGAGVEIVAQTASSFRSVNSAESAKKFRRGPNHLLGQSRATIELQVETVRSGGDEEDEFDHPAEELAQDQADELFEADTVRAPKRGRR